MDAFFSKELIMRDFFTMNHAVVESSCLKEMSHYVFRYIFHCFKIIILIFLFLISITKSGEFNYYDSRLIFKKMK